MAYALSFTERKEPPMTYNGWTNYETWAVHLWLTNEEGSYRHCRELAREARESAPTCRQVCQGVWQPDEASKFLLSDRLKESVEEMNPLADQPSLFSDLVTAALSEVDWHEVAQAFLDDL